MPQGKTNEVKPMKYLLGVDFGGSSSKATLLREDGVVAATASREGIAT